MLRSLNSDKHHIADTDEIHWEGTNFHYEHTGHVWDRIPLQPWTLERNFWEDWTHRPKWQTASHETPSPRIKGGFEPSLRMRNNWPTTVGPPLRSRTIAAEMGGTIAVIVFIDRSSEAGAARPGGMPTLHLLSCKLGVSCLPWSQVFHTSQAASGESV